MNCSLAVPRATKRETFHVVESPLSKAVSTGSIYLALYKTNIFANCVPFPELS
jgi:hypothetical protein